MPAWLAVTEQTPAPLVIVKVASEFVHDPDALYVTGKPELAIAATVKLLPKTATDGALVVNVTVWGWVTGTLSEPVALLAMPPSEAVAETASGPVALPATDTVTEIVALMLEAAF